MMKRFKALSLLLIGGFLVFGCFAALSGFQNNKVVYATETTSKTVNFAKSATKMELSGGEIEIDSVSWSYSSSSYFGNASGSLQIGKSKAKQESDVTFTAAVSSFISSGEVISKITVDARGGSTTNKVIVTVNNINYINSSLTTSSKVYSGTGSQNTGNVVITMSPNGSAQTMYLTDIIIYKDSSGSEKLSTPTNIAFSVNKITWNAVTNADKYKVKVDGIESAEITTNNYSTLDLPIMEHTFAIKAIDSTSTYSDSEYSENYSWSKTVTNVTSVGKHPTSVTKNATIRTSTVELNVSCNDGSNSVVNPTSISCDTSIVAQNVNATAYYSNATGTNSATFLINVIEEPTSYFIDTSGTADKENAAGQAKSAEALSIAYETPNQVEWLEGFSYAYAYGQVSSLQTQNTEYTLKLGTGNYNGQVLLGLKNKLSYISSVVVTAKWFKEADGSSLVVNDNEETKVKLTGSYVDYTFDVSSAKSYNVSIATDKLRCYISSIEIFYENTALYDYVVEFIGKTNKTCSNTISNWSSLETLFLALNSEDKNVLKNATHEDIPTYASDTTYTLENCVARYDSALLTTSSLNNFMNRSIANASIISIINSDSFSKITPIIISSVAILGAASFGVLLILKRKKKEN